MEQENLATGDVPLQPDDVWRQEVQARVTGYRSRKGRRIEGAFSMRFPFPPADVADDDLTPEEAVPEAHDDPVAPDPSPPASVDTQAEGAVLFDNRDVIEGAHPAAPARGKNKVIAFPKPLIPEPQYELPEINLPEQPRIL